MKKILYRSLTVVTVLLVIAIIGFVCWAKIYYKADSDKFSIATNQESNNVLIKEKSSYWEIIPNPPSSDTTKLQETGFIFYPGAKVDPKAYFYKLSSLYNGTVATIPVFITKPTLNLAFFSINQADQVIHDHTEIKKWIIAGHSLGGAMACEYVKGHTDTLSELWLLASYCASDISQTNLQVISIHGSLDGVLDSQKLAANRHNLPDNAQDIVIDGMNHAQFGNYGPQTGDNATQKSDDDAQTELIQIFNNVLTEK